MNILNFSNLNSDGKIIFKNFSYLSLLRIFNILSQYILVSFLVRTLGSETYGVFVWAFAIIQYLVIIVNFGFNTYAAKYVTDNNNDPNRINTIFSSIMGIKISLDDFGTVYSSLSLLTKLPIDELKIDKSFVDEIEQDLNAKSMVEGIIAIGKKLNFIIVAEGVETIEQLNELNKMGCDVYQGYYFAKPLNILDLKRYG